MPPFFVFALPRSRTTWFSRFLSSGDTVCLHDPSRWFRSLSDLDRLLAVPDIGASDTAMVLLWREIAARRPDVRFVAVRRRPAEVIESLARIGFCGDSVHREIARVGEALDGLPPETLTIRYEDLDEAGCSAIYRHCRGAPPPPGWWRFWAAEHVECDIAGETAEAVANRAGIEAVFGLP